MIRPARLRLNPLLYESLRQQILRRDSWRCQSCGTTSNLEVHHRELRSHSGADSEENLITLCTVCHAAVHRSEATYGQRLTPLDAKRGVTGGRE
jgi:5-methylcytosine-specific restriction endonuclease McrA